MAITIYKYAYHVDWDNKGVAVSRTSSGASTLPADLSNYYTKVQLGTPGLAIVDFANVANAYHNNMLGLQGGLEYSDSAPPDSDDSSGVPDVIHEFYHLSAYDYNRVITQTFIDSIVEESDFTIHLEGDVFNPGIDMYYGTDLTGVKGWYPLPEGFTDSSGAPGGDGLWELDSYPNLKPIDSYPLLIQDTLQIDGHAIYQRLNNSGFGYSLELSAGTSSTNDGGSIWIQGGYSEVAIGGSVYIIGGSSGNTSSGFGGNIYILPGFVQDSSVFSDFGNIYLGGNGIEGMLGVLPLAESADNYVVHYNPTTGKLSYDLAGGVIPQDGLLKWDLAYSYYRPYNSFDEGEAEAQLYWGTVDPVGTTRLNYNGYFYATKLFSEGVEVTNFWELESPNVLILREDLGINGIEFKLPVHFAGDASVIKELQIALLSLFMGDPTPDIGPVGLSYTIGDNSTFFFKIPNDLPDLTPMTFRVYWAIEEDRSSNDEKVCWNLTYTPWYVGGSFGDEYELSSGDVSIPELGGQLTYTDFTLDEYNIINIDLLWILLERVELEGSDGEDPDAEPVIVQVVLRYESDRLGEMVTSYPFP